MDLTTNEALTVLKVLLPGLVGSWAFRAVSPHGRPEGLAAIIEALLFTSVSALVLALVENLSLWLGKHVLAFGSWTLQTEYVTSMIVGLVLGGLAGFSSNRDWLHNALRYLKITKNTASPSEWYRAFYDNERHIIIHLRDGRRIQGWPAEYPNSPSEGHFCLGQAAWLPDEGPPVTLENACSMLIPASEVLYVEFLKWTVEVAGNEQEGSPKHDADPAA